VVAVGGGHGLAATLRAVRRYAGEVTAVVTVADDGGSTGRLRAAEDRPAPGDLRKCLVALGDEASLLARSMEHRFDAGELEGHALGNLLIVAMAETGGDLVAALDEIGRMVGAVGRVLPATTEAVELRADLHSGEQVAGQVAVGARGDLCTVDVFPPDVEACKEAVDAIGLADQIVLGPGSLFTSVLAAAAVPGVKRALQASHAQLVHVCNLRPQDNETAGYDVAAHVAALERHGLVPDVVLFDPDTIGGAEGVDRAVAAPVARRSGLAHDPELLAGELERLWRSSSGASSSWSRSPSTGSS
jgi:uncharacterized cofD-like protein